MQQSKLKQIIHRQFVEGDTSDPFTLVVNCIKEAEKAGILTILERQLLEFEECE